MFRMRWNLAARATIDAVAEIDAAARLCSLLPPPEIEAFDVSMCDDFAGPHAPVSAINRPTKVVFVLWGFLESTTPVWVPEGRGCSCAACRPVDLCWTPPTGSSWKTVFQTSALIGSARGLACHAGPSSCTSTARTSFWPRCWSMCGQPLPRIARLGRMRSQQALAAEQRIEDHRAAGR